MYALIREKFKEYTHNNHDIKEDDVDWFMYYDYSNEEKFVAFREFLMHTSLSDSPNDSNILRYVIKRSLECTYKYMHVNRNKKHIRAAASVNYYLTDMIEHLMAFRLSLKHNDYQDTWLQFDVVFQWFHNLPIDHNKLFVALMDSLNACALDPKNLYNLIDAKSCAHHRAPGMWANRDDSHAVDEFVGYYVWYSPKEVYEDFWDWIVAIANYGEFDPYDLNIHNDKAREELRKIFEARKQSGIKTKVAIKN